MKTIAQLMCAAALLALLVPEDAFAIPAFARKYDMSCNVCHSPVPKLKPYGDEFAANGYQMKGNEPPRFVRQTGDDRLFLMRELPLAIRVDGYARYVKGNNPESDIEWPYILKILSGGQIAHDVSYFFYFLFDERGEIAGVEDAFLYFNDLWSSEVDLMVGQYQVADPIFKRELRPMFEDYEIYKVKPGNAKADLTYDRGLTVSTALSTGTDVLVSVLNGNGIGAAAGTFDDDPYKNAFVRLAQPVDSLIKIGGLAYWGKERYGNGTINRTTMFGGDGSISFGIVELAGQYLVRKDTNPFSVAGKDSSMTTRGGFLQVMIAPQRDRSEWYLFFLYNKVKSGDASIDYHSVAGNFTYLLARNLKVMGEYAYDLERKTHGVTIGFMTAF